MYMRGKGVSMYLSDIIDLCDYHGSNYGGQEWKLTPYIQIKGEGDNRRTPGYPTTVSTIWDKYQTEIKLASVETLCPIEIIVAIIATESKGNTNAVREEPGYRKNYAKHLISVGLMQPLITTAEQMLNKTLNVTKLQVPLTNILAGAKYVQYQANVSNTLLDPVLSAAAYNAGGLYEDSQNEFGLVVYKDHLDRFIRWYNDFIYWRFYEKTE